MKQTDWQENESDHFYSHHLITMYSGDEYPTYHILKNPDEDNGWVIGMFYSFIGGEYVPLEEDGEERLVFNTAEEAMKYVDEILAKNRN